MSGQAKSPLKVERDGPVLIVGVDRPEKRNALNDAVIAALDELFSKLPDDARAVLIHSTGPNFSAGLDLSEIAERDAHEGVLHSRSWHQCFEKIEFGSLPVVAVLRGAVVGGGLELAAAAHVRVAERSAFYALPEGQRGIFVGGGGSVRVPRLIGVSRMADMMLTGRVYSAAGRRGRSALRNISSTTARATPRAWSSRTRWPATRRSRISRSSRRCRASPRPTRASAMSWNP